MYKIILIVSMIFIAVVVYASYSFNWHTNPTPPPVVLDVHKDKNYGRVVNIWDVNYFTIEEAEFLPNIQRTCFNLYGVEPPTEAAANKEAIKYLVNLVLGKNVAYKLVIDPVTKTSTNYIWVYLLDVEDTEVPLNILLLKEGHATTLDPELKQYEDEAHVAGLGLWDN